MSGKRDRRAPPDHEFRVVWGRKDFRFDIYRDGVPTGSHATSKAVAVEIAIREARRHVNGTGRFVVVTSTLNGQRILEWDGFYERAYPG